MVQIASGPTPSPAYGEVGDKIRRRGIHYNYINHTATPRTNHLPLNVTTTTYDVIYWLLPYGAAHKEAW